MLESVFDSADLPAPDRFDYAREAMSRLPAPYDASTEHADGFRMRQHELHLGSVRVWNMAMQPMTLHRTARLIRRSDPESYNIVLLQHGTFGRTWGRHETTYGPDELHINHSSQVHELRAHSTRGMIRCMGVAIPEKLLSLPRNRTEQLVGRRLKNGEGIAALLSGFLTQLTANAGSYRPSDSSRLGTVVVDLSTALFAHALETDDNPPPDTLILRIRGFIQQHLHDPRLAPSTVAAAHYISTSYLHRLFQRDGTTVATWIREQRLKRARRDLNDPALATIPIGEIAARWGFAHPAAFSRAFRTAFGIAPKDFRQQALDTPS